MWFTKQRDPQGIYGDVERGQRPWWARPFAFPGVQVLLGYLATALLIYSIWYGFARVNSPNFEPSDIVDHCKNEGAPKPDAKPSAGDERRLTRVGFQKAILIVIWVLVPPIWFWLEYFGIWRYEDKDKRQCLEELKLGQELAAKIWLAAITALGILYFGKDIKGGG